MGLTTRAESRLRTRSHAALNVLQRCGLLVGSATLSTILMSGCATHQPPISSASNEGSALTLEGTWSMDLSPAQDGSYIKDMVIVADAGKDGISPHTFTGTVYGGSPFDNGQCINTPSGNAFAFVSDEKGELGGPYYWLGQRRPDQKDTRPAGSPSEEVLTGRVRSLSRNLDMQWRATRSSAR